MTDDTHTNEVPDAPHDSPVVLAHVIAEAVRDLAAGMPVHEHAWDILDVQEAPRPPVLLPMQATVTSTYVLLRCVSCGLPDALTLPGSWTLAQVHADAFADEREAFLTELGNMPVAELTALLAPYRRIDWTEPRSGYTR